MTSDELISLLGLKPLPKEGGYFSESYRSDETIQNVALPKRYKNEKSFSTCIYYLLTPNTFSAIHRLPTDEIYHFYLGSPVQMLQLYPDGKGKVIKLGHDIRQGENVQILVPKGVWQGSFLLKGEFALMGTTMAPGFDFLDYEESHREALIRQYPEHRDLIAKLTTQ